MAHAMLDDFKHALVNQNLAASGQCLVQMAQYIGWNEVAFNADISNHHLPVDEKGQYLARSMGWSPDILTEWENRRLAEDCPVTQACKRTMAPFYWDVGGSEAWDVGALREEQKNALRHYSSYSGAGVTVPVHRPQGRAAYVTWISRSREQAQQLYTDHRDLLFLAAHYYVQWFDERYDHIQPEKPSDKVNLTARELECLTWASRGKTEEEIGMILGRSQATSRFHLRNAISKLNASNRTHAVAKACSMGLISSCF